MTPLTIFAAFREAFTHLESIPHWLASVAVPNAPEHLPAAALFLGDESPRPGKGTQGTQDEPGVHTRRTLRVLVSITAGTRDDAEAIAWQVQNVAPYGGPGFSANWIGNARDEKRATPGGGEMVFYSVLVNFDVQFSAESPPSS